MPGVPGQAGGFRVICLGPIRFKEPVSGAGVAVDGRRSARGLERGFEGVDAGGRLIWIVLREVAQVGGFRALEVLAPTPVKDDDRVNALGLGDGEIEGI